MKQSRLWITVAIACLAGFGCAELAARSVVVRDKLGNLFDRGYLAAVVGGRGIYLADVHRREGELPLCGHECALTDLISNTAAISLAENERIGTEKVERELLLLRSQFGNSAIWRTALHGSGLFSFSLLRILKDDLRARQWIEKRIAHDVVVRDDQCREFYDSHLDRFFLPERRNVAHLFVAAPPETPPDVVESKRAAIEALSVRLAAGEDFAALVAQNSEDEATKFWGGELGYFSANRMPPDFVEAAKKLHPGEISKPVRTRLGFHILRLIDVQPPRQQIFDEVRNDIAIEIANEKRVVIVEKLVADLRRNASYLRPF
ncbi:MAG TPA: peptidylprolyl isomerase [Chthoniobacterales bacterium]|nr:peptidylprolyl isomerase [Chthoniobacterales bacterium]